MEGVLMVSPSKIASLSLPPLVRRKIFGNGQAGLWLSSRATARGESTSIPWAASPPSAFCQEKVATSSLAQSSLCANAAEVASQIERPSRSAAIQLPSGTRTPDVVPFQVKTTSFDQSTLPRLGSTSYADLRTVVSLSSSSLSTSLTQPSPNDSHASMVTGRAPSSDHIAISTAPVSDAGTIPTR